MALHLEVNFSGEPLVMNHSDIHPSNFLIDPATRQVTIADFGNVSALPLSFVSFTLHATSDNFITGISRSLCWERSENLRAMGAATGILWKMSSSTLGTLHLLLDVRRRN